MHDNGIEEIITKLYNLIQDARSMPLAADKCIVERDRVLDLLDDISNALPGELKQSKTIEESRNDLIASAKREAETIIRNAQAQAKQLTTREAVYQEAKLQADEMVANAQDRIRELKKVTNAYVDDCMKRTEEAITDALNQVHDSRVKFNKLVNPQAAANASPIIQDI